MRTLRSARYRRGIWCIPETPWIRRGFRRILVLLYCYRRASGRAGEVSLPPPGITETLHITRDHGQWRFEACGRSSTISETQEGFVVAPRGETHGRYIWILGKTAFELPTLTAVTLLPLDSEDISYIYWGSSTLPGWPCR